MQTWTHVDQTPKPPPETVALGLTDRGAILTLAGIPPQHFLVGDFAWLGPRHIFWFVAHGDVEDDGRLLEFDELRVLPRERIVFTRDSSVIAHLGSIDEADVEDPDDYRVAWGIWQQVGPTRGDLIARSRARRASSVTA